MTLTLTLMPILWTRTWIWIWTWTWVMGDDVVDSDGTMEAGSGERDERVNAR